MRPTILIAFVFGVLVSSAAVFAAPQEGDTQAKFTAALGEFNKQRTAAIELRNKIAKAEEEAQKKLIAEYEKAVEGIRASLDALRGAALAAYKAAPNEDETVVQVLLGLARENLLADQVEKAGETLSLLKEKGCERKELNCLLGVAAYFQDDFEEAEKQLTIANKGGAIGAYEIASGLLADCEEAKKVWKEELAFREAEAKANDLPRVKLETSKGAIVIELFENEAPETVGNFVSLVEKKYYDGLKFHRVLGNFMAQGGDPKGDGSGGPGYTIYCECVKTPHRNHFRGVLSMAKTSAPNTGGSQFFLTFLRTPHLDGEHTVFGRVIEGLDVLEKLQRTDSSAGDAKPDVIVKAEVIRKRDHEYKPKKVAK